MTKRREKAKPIRTENNKQLATEDTVRVSNLKEKNKRLRTFMYETGKFLVDIAKLVFGGVILAGIMNEEINRTLLFSTGTIIVLVASLTGLTLISNNKED